MVALAASVQEVFAFSGVLVVVPAWEGSFTGSYDWSCCTWICRNTERDIMNMFYLLSDIEFTALKGSFMCRAVVPSIFCLMS